MVTSRRKGKTKIIIAILEILNKHTNPDNSLTAKQISDYLISDYGIEVDRKTIVPNIMDLIDLGYDINYSEEIRKLKDGREEILKTDWYIIHEFEDYELRLLIDSILSSKRIPAGQCNDLIDRLVAQSSKYFEPHSGHIQNLPEEKVLRNSELFYSIEIIDEAISKKKKVKFEYIYFNEKKKPQPFLAKNGNSITYIMNPYQMVATNGRYYLICNNDRYDLINYYRVDRIKDIEILYDSDIKPLSELTSNTYELNLPKLMAEHVYMFSGDSINVDFRVDLNNTPNIFTDIVDWFGMNFHVKEEKENSFIVSVKVNEQAMFYWSLQYGLAVEIVSPPKLREKISTAAKKIAAKYD